VVLTSKALSTDITGERALVSVRAFVYHQVVGLGELAVARAADELLSTSAHSRIHKISQDINILTILLKNKRRLSWFNVTLCLFAI